MQPSGLRTKFGRLGMSDQAIARRLRDLHERSDYHIRALGAVIADDLDPPAAASIDAAGGAKMVLQTVQDLLLNKLHLPPQEGMP